jgi:ABC-type lipoprotein release transport system permease subunit
VGPPDVGSKPPAIVNVARIRGIPFVLAALLAALTVLTLVHVLLTSLNGRQRDVAVMRSLGADQAWVTRAMHWQATSFALPPIVIGVPLGVLGGRLVFALFADSMGAVDAPSIPIALVGLVLVALTVLANIATEVPARRARRTLPAVTLRTE